MNSHLSHQTIGHKKDHIAFADEYPGLVLGQTQKCDMVKQINGISTLPLLII